MGKSDLEKWEGLIGKMKRTDSKNGEVLTLNTEGLSQNREGPIQKRVGLTQKKKVLWTSHSHRIIG